MKEHIKTTPSPALHDNNLKMLELLHHLCGGSEMTFDWILKWCAYPMQHPGAKMRTAIVMNGPEGAGKNIWWDAIREIYGEYGYTIDQSELASQFNSWALWKLFCVSNAAPFRQAKHHQNDRIKNMITDPDWVIHKKMQEPRIEKNNCNFVFLSNAITAVPAEDNRRYLVTLSPPKREHEFYTAIAAEHRRAGPSPLLNYLLRYELEDFNEHTKPFETGPT